jgi:hypothetical protein
VDVAPRRRLGYLQIRLARLGRICLVAIMTAIGLLVLTGIVQLTLETSAELTAETFADNDVGIAPVRSQVAVGQIIDTDPAVMLVPTR